MDPTILIILLTVALFVTTPATLLLAVRLITINRSVFSKTEVKQYTETIRIIQKSKGMSLNGAKYLNALEAIITQEVFPGEQMMCIEEDCTTHRVILARGSTSNMIATREKFVDLLEEAPVAWVSAVDSFFHSHTNVTGKAVAFKLSDANIDRYYLIALSNFKSDFKGDQFVELFQQVLFVIDGVRHSHKERLEADNLITNLQEKYIDYVQIVAGIRHDLKGAFGAMIGPLNRLIETVSETPDCDPGINSALAELTPLIMPYQQFVASMDDTIRSLVEPDRNMKLIEMALSFTFHSYFDGWIESRRETLPEITVSVDIPEDLMIQANEVAFYQSLWNVMRNAYAYTRKGAITISAFLGGGDLIYVKIVDSGPGIPENELEHIGQFGFRASSNAEIHGHGQGIYFTKRLLEAMGGELKIESKVGIGTAFYLGFLKGVE